MEHPLVVGGFPEAQVYCSRASRARVRNRIKTDAKFSKLGMVVMPSLKHKSLNIQRSTVNQVSVAVTCNRAWTFFSVVLHNVFSVERNINRFEIGKFIWSVKNNRILSNL